MQELYSQTGAPSHSQEVSKVLRNTYSMLAMTLVVSAIAAGLAMAVGLGHGLALVFNIVAIALLWFVLPRTANSSSGVFVVFAFTALLGAGLGPMLTNVTSLPNGSMYVMQALGATALIFFALSGYVLTTGKDFSFMGGFLTVGLLVVIVALVGSFLANMLGYGHLVSGLSLAISGVIVFIMSGFILYDTSRIINGGERNYLLATVSLYLNILNLFTALLHLITAFGGDD